MRSHVLARHGAAKGGNREQLPVEATSEEFQNVTIGV